jgi:hypothetical protein
VRIPDDVLDKAFRRFHASPESPWTDDDVRALVSWIVERSIDYEAAANGYGIGLQEAIDVVNLALGIGGDD